MKRRIALLVLFFGLAAPVAAESPAEVRALGQALRDPDLEKAAVAAKRLRQLGAEAAPAMDDLIAALDRVIPEPQSQRVWHKWMAVMPTYQREVVKALLAIGPRAKAALPKLLSRLDGSSGDWLAKPLFDEWRDKVPGAREGLLAWVRGGRVEVTAPLKDRVHAWVVSLGAEAVPIWDAWLQRRVGDQGLALRVLHDAGDAGLPLLQKHFHRDRALQNAMLKMWIAAGELPAFATDVALDRLASESMEREAPALVAILAGRKTDVAPRLAARLIAQRFHWPTWCALTSHGGAFGRRVGRHWVAAYGPKLRRSGFDALGHRMTPALGGPGGTVFRETPGGLLVGLRYTYELVNWAPAIRSIQGLFWHEGKMLEGKVYGKHGAKRGEVMSQPGYAIGGLYAQHGERFQGFAVVYMRHLPGRLDPTDAYIDTWHGSSIIGHAEVRLAGEGHEIVGLHGRAGADIDAFGLIERRISKQQ